ncbi:protein Wnt-6-like isoform X1 [Cloeon dipterum]|uniref:protein Wnt-6-like isoform X1 n=1 Tax=Cloeon dipterum TaxID=197152 RepID=UPI0032205C36
MDLRPLVICIILVSPVTGLWWAVSNQVLADPHIICRRTKRLRPKVADTCRKEIETGLLKELAKGAQLGSKECQFQFRNRRWNCTTAKKSIRLVLMSDTRESGFVNAITAAGVAFAVTRACSTGSLMDCGCDSKLKYKDTEDGASMTSPQKHRVHKQKGKGRKGNKQRKEALKQSEGTTATEWRWNGCGDNINYGVRKSREWMDAPYRRQSDIKTLVMLHNNNAGRLAVKNYMIIECKCHGLSGSCTMRTCWSRMPTFRDIGHRLKDHFDGAIKVLPSNDGRSFLAAGDPSIKPPGREDIVYSEDSPEFCNPHPRTGSLGTQGRVCNVSSAGVGGCDLLCCGRGHDTKQIKHVYNCDCRFKWCCNVTCNTCQEKRSLHTCR